MRFNRNQIYLIGLGILIGLIFLYKCSFLIRSEHAEGEIVDTHVRRTKGVYAGLYYHPVVKFTAENYEITFTGEEDSNFELRDKVDVVYLKSDLTHAKIYSLNGFWLPTFIYALIPFFVLTAAVFSFISSTETVEINLPKFLSFKEILKK